MNLLIRLWTFGIRATNSHLQVSIHANRDNGRFVGSCALPWKPRNESTTWQEVLAICCLLATVATSQCSERSLLVQFTGNGCPAKTPTFSTLPQPVRDRLFRELWPSLLTTNRLNRCRYLIPKPEKKPEGMTLLYIPTETLIMEWRKTIFFILLIIKICDLC